jgi:hypothetical protein
MEVRPKFLKGRDIPKKIPPERNSGWRIYWDSSQLDSKCASIFFIRWKVIFVFNAFFVPLAKSCDVLYKSGKTITGVYTIHPDGQGYFQVRCDMTSTPGRGWTIFQRRVDGSVDFYRNWNDYKNGFGKLTDEFWLGLDKIHRLSANGHNVLRVDLESFENETRYVNFGTFAVGNENEGYILSIGQYTGKNIFNIERSIESLSS